MARLVPSARSADLAAELHPGEAATLKQLARDLPNDYTVFHSVHWSVSSKDRSRFGEVDFVIVNRSGHVLLIEQKNGPLREIDGELHKEYSGEAKSVHSQIGRSIVAVRRKFSSQFGGGLILDYLIFLPDHRLVQVSSAMVDAERIVDAVARNDLGAKIQALLGAGSSQEEDQARRVTAFFGQMYRIAPDVGQAIAAGEQSYLRLSGGLLEVIENLDFSPFRLRIQGVAGCGKTQVALQFLVDHAQTQRPLFVCFNRPLRDQMHQQVTEQGVDALVETFHGLCVHALSLAGQKVDFSAAAGNPRFFDELVERVIAMDVPEALKFSSLVVDEGQDFRQEWWDVLQLFLAEDYRLIWFEDPNQNLMGVESIDVPATVTYRANVSYRTPPSIAGFIAEAHDIVFDSGLPIPGLGVGVHEYAEPREQVAMVRARVNELRRQGFANEDIVVLTCGGLDRSELYALDEIAGVKIRKFTKEYDRDRAPIYTAGRILFDSVYRFKGGQAPCVILTDVDPSDRLVNAGRPVVFCGMTRATMRLEMLIRKDNPHVATYRAPAA